MSYHWPSKKLGAAAIITDPEGHVLLVKHGYGGLNWEIPGGAVETNESIADAAVREVREETGLSVRAERLSGIYYMAGDDSHHFVFRCEATAPDRPPKPDLAEITDCGYFPPEALPRPMTDFTERRIRDALSGLDLTVPAAIGPRRWLE